MPRPEQRLVTFSIDGLEVTAPENVMLVDGAKYGDVEIPVFCYEPKLGAPVGACRMCLVEIAGIPKLQPACSTPVKDGMVGHTQTDRVREAQEAVVEFLLVNHPLDCPVCDKGGECPLQDQAMSNGRAETRFVETKRTYPKPLPISSQVLLDRERCVLCARCTRFSQQVAGAPFNELFGRGALEQVAIYEDEPFESYFSGNTTQICPVGALTSAAYRFRARPFDLRSEPSVCEHCASGCAQRTDYRRGTVQRRLAGEDPAVNEEWNCDKGRYAIRYATSPEAWAAAAEGLRQARDDGGVGVLPGGRLTLEDAYAYAKFARLALHTNDIDARARAHSAEELAFLEAEIAGTGPWTGGVTYDDLAAAPAVLLVAFEPEEESPIVFLRLRKAVRKTGLAVFDLAPFATRAAEKLQATVLATLPGQEARSLAALTDGSWGGAAVEALRQPGAIVLAGERLAEVPGGFYA